jgi:hypothetical protein
MCLDPRFFEPQETTDADDQVIPWKWPPGLKEDRKYGKNAARWMLNRFKSIIPDVQDYIMSIADKVKAELDQRRKTPPLGDTGLVEGLLIEGGSREAPDNAMEVD